MAPPTGQETVTPAGRRERPGGRPPAEADAPRSYYGRAILADPVWSFEIPLYFFTGGLAGASATLALGGELAGRRRLARRAWLTALGGVVVSPALLVSDLGRPARFLNMLRLFKVTSPMSVGSWVLSATGAAVTAATARATLGVLPRAGRLAGALAGGALGPVLSTYTAVLVADTAVPVWHEAHRTLPLVFAGSSLASAGAVAVLCNPPAEAAPARRLTIAGVALSEAADQVMQRRLGELAEPYHQGAAGALDKAAKGLLLAGAGVVAAGRRGRAAAAVGGALVLGGVACERWAIFRAGFQSARDPRYAAGPQRRRLAARGGRPTTP